MTAKGQQEELLLVRHNVGGALVPVPAGSRFESGVVQLQQRFRNEQTAKAKGMRKNKGTFREQEQQMETMDLHNLESPSHSGGPRKAGNGIALNVWDAGAPTAAKNPR